MNTLITPWLISTDMDGTLLNHDDYRWQYAKPCIEFLQDKNIPIILNTSKTYAEVSDWIIELNIAHPFVTENGSAIFCPVNYFDNELLKHANIESETYATYQAIYPGISIKRLQSFREQYMPGFESLADCSLPRAIEMTGLTEKEAIAAQQRQFTLPLWLDDNFDYTDYAEALTDAGLQLLRGGRFAHLMGLCDKGTAIDLLARLYQARSGKRPNVLALGDSGNDVAMLSKADVAVVVKNYQNNWLQVADKEVYQTQQQAPEGWVEGVVHMLADDYNEIRSFNHGR